MSSSNIDLSSEAFHKTIRQELKNYHHIDEPPAAGLLKLHVVRNQLETQSQPNAPFAKRLALNTVLHEAIEDTYKENKDLATLLRKRFLDRETIPDVSEHFHISQATVSRWTDKALELFCDNFQALEEQAKESWFNRLEARLPSQSYSRLVGVEKLHTKALKQLTDPNGAGIVTLFGIGGIGKSSLADYIARSALRSGLFQNVSWILFRPEQSDWLLIEAKIKQQLVSLMVQSIMPSAVPLSLERQSERLADRLKREPHLVIVDNLEEQQSTDEIIDYLNGIKFPSRFIVTTRARPARGSCHVLNLTELDRDNSLNLMQYYLESTGQTEIGKVDFETLNKIYQIVGGNPLALKITAGLLQWLPLEKTLIDLEKGRGNAAVLYKKIFRNTWETISPASQLLLKAMSLTGSVSGASPAQMQEASGLPNDQFWQAVDELILRSMLEVLGPIDNRRYGIHRLTESFIESEIINPSDG